MTIVRNNCFNKLIMMAENHGCSLSISTNIGMAIILRPKTQRLTKEI